MNGGKRVSLLDVECGAATVAVDTGMGNTAVGFLRGADILNCAVLRPRQAGELVRVDAPKPDGRYRTMAEMIDLMSGVARRVRDAHDWLVRTYTVDDDEPVHVVVEVPEGIPRGWSALAKTLTITLAGMVRNDLDGVALETVSRLCVGERHHASRNPTGKPVPVGDCYPPLIHDRWPEFAAPDPEGRRVRMLPNEDVGKRGTGEVVPRRRCRDAQQVFDIAKLYWLDDDEWEPFKLKAAPRRARRKARRAA